MNWRISRERRGGLEERRRMRRGRRKSQGQSVLGAASHVPRGWQGAHSSFPPSSSPCSSSSSFSCTTKLSLVSFYGGVKRVIKYRILVLGGHGRTKALWEKKELQEVEEEYKGNIIGIQRKIGEGEGRGREGGNVRRKCRVLRMMS